MSASTQQKQITQAILTLRSEYISEGQASSYYEINNGDCEDFGEEIVSRVSLDGSSAYTVCGENFMVDCGGGDESWDSKLLLDFWGMSPPEQLTWDMLNEIPFGGHVWITDGKRHYDAESPEGVENFFDLPIFRRPIVTYLRENGISCSDVVTEDVVQAPLCPIQNPEAVQVRRVRP